MRVVETNECSCSVGVSIMQNLPVVERSRDILTVVEEDVLVVVVGVRELENSTCPSVD